MKPNIALFIVAAAGIGFAVGWLLKPEAPPTPAVVRTPPPRPKVAPPATIEETPSDRPTPAPRRDASANLAPRPLDPQIKSRDEAKLARLAEALNLNEEQKAAVLAATLKAEGILAPETKLDPNQMLRTALEAAGVLDQALAGVLTPEQAEAFAKLRQRTQENNIEDASQNRLRDLSKLTDLSPEQRSQILDLIRDDIRTGYQAHPEDLDLVMESSVLPIGSTFIADNSVDRLLFSQNSRDPVNIDPVADQMGFAELQRRSLDAQLETYKSILTPAQYARLKVDTEERKQALDKLNNLLR